MRSVVGKLGAGVFVLATLVAAPVPFDVEVVLVDGFAEWPAALSEEDVAPWNSIEGTTVCGSSGEETFLG
jgi:hypothetical protein